MDSSSNKEASCLEQVRNKRNGKKKLPKFHEFRDGTDLRHVTLKLGLCFPNASIFKNLIREYAVRVGKDIYFKKHNPGRVRAECEDLKCKWVCYASLLGIPRCIS